jgi:hypothetical protein
MAQIPRQLQRRAHPVQPARGLAHVPQAAGKGAPDSSAQHCASVSYICRASSAHSVPRRLHAATRCDGDQNKQEYENAVHHSGRTRQQVL